MLEERDGHDDGIVSEDQEAFIGIVPLEGKVRLSVHYEITLALSELDDLMEAVKEKVDELIEDSPPEEGDTIFLDTIIGGCIGNRMDVYDATAKAIHEIRAASLNRAIGISLD